MYVKNKTKNIGRENLKGMISSYLMLLPFAILFFIFTILPILSSAALSLFNYDMISTPKFTGASNYLRMFLNDDVFRISLKNTIYFAVITGPLGFFLSFILAWMINEFRPIIRSLLSFLFYAPSLAGNVFFVWQVLFSGDSYGYINSILLNIGIITEPIQWLRNSDYTITVELLHNGKVVDAKKRRVGFRHIELVLEENAREEGGFPKTRIPPPITIKINGKRIFAKGTNWVCPTIFPGTLNEEVYRPYLELIRDANMNLIRCWGGAVVNKDEFFDLCDELGLMVWQEFPLSCNNYLGTPEYLSVLDHESKAIIRQLRRHPCHVIWCGGNELFNSWSGMTDQSKALRLLNRNCFDMDPDKPFLMTSPLMGIGHGGYSFWDSDGTDIFVRINNSSYHAYTEFGCSSGASWKTIMETFPEDQLREPGVGSCWESHFAVGAWDSDSWLYISSIREHFPDATSPEQIIKVSRELQSVGLQYFFEEAQRQWPRCSMALNWCFNEPYPCAANNSIIGYNLEIKPAYKAICKALRQTFLSARIPRFEHPAGGTIEIELWLITEKTVKVTGATVDVAIICGNAVSKERYVFENEEEKANRLLKIMKLQLPQRTGWFDLRLDCQLHPEWASDYRLVTRTR